MADNVQVKNAAGSNVSAAADELSDSSFSPKVSVLAGDGSATPIDPRRITALPGQEYERVAASQTEQALGATGATGDLLVGLLVIPATTSPGAISIEDGDTSPGTSMTVFAGGASSVTNLVPFFIPLGIVSVVGAWRVTTGANVSVIAVGDFT
jgi:hypothetical protein